LEINMAFMKGKKALICGLASQRSIAWGIAQAMKREGAELAFSYQGEKLKGRVEEMAAELGSNIVLPCDVADDGEIDAMFTALGKQWDGLDCLVHSIGFAPREQLDGNYIDAVTREGFRIAHDISSYSLAALAKAARPLMAGRNGSVLTLTYLGAVRALPSYNVMGLAKASLEANVRFLAFDLGAEGIRVNAISAGPIKTLAAAGIPGFSKILDAYRTKAPLRRTVDAAEVADAALWLLGPAGRGITGEVVMVDGGYHAIGV
jgi:enoyl-[acyl-carrier protein] reductase I